MHHMSLQASRQAIRQADRQAGCFLGPKTRHVGEREQLPQTDCNNPRHSHRQPGAGGGRDEEPKK
eukprot:21260-Chlamydomonas_euryale.AAC.2